MVVAIIGGHESLFGIGDGLRINLERNIFDLHFFFLAHGRLGGSGGGVGRSWRATLTWTVEHNDVVGDNFGTAALLAVLRFPITGLQASFHVYAATFCEVLRADFCELAPGDDVVKLRSFLALAGGVCPYGRCCDTEVRDSLPGTRGTRFRVFGHVANDHGAVETHHRYCEKVAAVTIWGNQQGLAATVRIGIEVGYPHFLA